MMYHLNLSKLYKFLIFSFLTMVTMILFLILSRPIRVYADGTSSDIISASGRASSSSGSTSPGSSYTLSSTTAIASGSKTFTFSNVNQNGNGGVVSISFPVPNFSASQMPFTGSIYNVSSSISNTSYYYTVNDSSIHYTAGTYNLNLSGSNSSITINLYFSGSVTTTWTNHSQYTLNDSFITGLVCVTPSISCTYTSNPPKPVNEPDEPFPGLNLITKGSSHLGSYTVNLVEQNLGSVNTVTLSTITNNSFVPSFEYFGDVLVAFAIPNWPSFSLPAGCTLWNPYYTISGFNFSSDVHFFVPFQPFYTYGVSPQNTYFYPGVTCKFGFEVNLDFTLSAGTKSSSFTMPAYDVYYWVYEFDSNSDNILIDIDNNIVSAGGNNGHLNDQNQAVNDAMDEYFDQTDTSQQYEVINSLDFTFDTSLMTQLAPTATFFASCVSSIISNMSDYGGVYLLFMVFALMSAIIGIVRYVNSDSGGGDADA